MDALTLGPLMLPYSRLPGLLAMVLLLLGSEWLNKRYTGLARWGWMALLIGALGGRLAYALTTPSAYLQEPWTLFYFWQPGYLWWGALAAAGLFTLGYWRRKNPQKNASLTLLGITTASALLLMALLPSGHWGERIPPLPLTSLQGETLNLDQLQGQPLIVNLWATWCPPCRREMPLLESYEDDDRLRIVLLNQGESLLAVTNYLDEHQLSFQHLYLDARQQAMAHFNAPGLPTTLFYDAQGQLVDRHIGELSRGQIERFIRSQVQSLDN